MVVAVGDIRAGREEERGRVVVVVLGIGRRRIREAMTKREIKRNG